tara:strand:- start:151 stop:387 length:237 start_codon:yes stop_codon:yes gene_type:complete
VRTQVLKCIQKGVDMKKLEIEIKCPNCSRVLKQRLDQMKNGRSKRCTCGCEIVFEGNGGPSAQRSLEKFERDLKRIFK